MPVRSLKLKTVLNRGEAGKQVRQSLWLTHTIVNEAVAEVERILLLCRGTEYCTGEDEVVSKAKVRGDALAFARQIQHNNGKARAGSDEEVLAALRQLYEALVPSVLFDDEGKPLTGDAQRAGGFAGPMMDPRSQGFQNVFDKILDPRPAWIAKMLQGATDWERESNEWLESPESQRLQHATGSPPAWVRRLRAGQPWQDAFVQDQERKRGEAGAVAAIIRLMKTELRLLPLMPPPVTSRLAVRPSGLTPWDRLALRLAVAHLLSWETWNHRAAAEYAAIEAQVDRQAEQVAAYGSVVGLLRGYERDRHEELKRVAEASDDRPYRIGPRAIRAWDRVRETWLGPRGVSRASRVEALAELQTKLGGRFGDPTLFRGLAENGREHLWRDRDPLPALARLNVLQRQLERKKEHALCTPAECRVHPRWIGYEAPGGGNLRTYGFEAGQDGITLCMPLLTQVEGGLAEMAFDVPLAPSGQLRSPKWNGKQGKARRLVYSSAQQTFSATPGGGEILFARRHLENRDPEELASGDVGPVWFKLVLDVDSQAPEGWLDGRGRVVTPPAVHHFNSGLATKSRHTDALVPGLRVLSVDLGVRTFAACSVFELVQGKPDGRLAFLADAERDLWARHERSFLLTMPGEAPAAQALTARRAAYDQLASLRRDLSRLKALLRLSVEQAEEERRAQVVELCASIEDESVRRGTTSFTLPAIQSLHDAVTSAQPTWEEIVKRVHRDTEKHLGERISQWRRRTRPRAADKADRLERRAYLGGKSAWAVEYLDNVRRFLLGWSLHGRRYGQINRADREKRGTFAVRLLQHLNALKDDRTKAGSDLIVQAARGWVPDRGKGWVHLHEPCRLILFEDLARYRFRTDRPRRENSQLMRWSHRRLIDETTMQAELYGIAIGTTGAGFSSRFHARTGAPGCRVRTLTSEDLQSPGVLKELEFLAERLGIDARRLQPGERVPWEGGEDLATIGDGGNLLMIHADLNAAQNLQRRFWTRHGDAYRITALEVRQGGHSRWYPDADGSRLRGALALLVGGDGYARLVPFEDADVFQLQKTQRAHWTEATRGRAVAGEEEALSDGDAQTAMTELCEEFERTEGRQVFFRDPSGLVLRSDRWYDAKVFWGRVHRRIAHALGLLSPAS